MHAFCRYFRLYLKKVAPTQDLEISVQCDVAVFSWLLQYTKAAAARRQSPVLTISNCMPVLIASHFLQVSCLVPCWAFILPSAKAAQWLRHCSVSPGCWCCSPGLSFHTLLAARLASAVTQDAL